MPGLRGGPVITRRRMRHKPLPDRRTVKEWRANGRVLEPGVEFSVKGEPGRFVFLSVTEKDDGKVWVNAVGGPKGHRLYRAFYPERVKTVHRLKRAKSTKDLAAEHRAKQRQKREEAAA